MQGITEEKKRVLKKIIIGVCISVAFIFLVAKVVIPNYNYKAALDAYMALHDYTEAEKADSERELLKCARVGDSVYFGSYQQLSSNSYKQRIEWRVLAKEDNKILVISEYVLDRQPYDEQERKKVTWETCTLRSWLNSTFLDDAFSMDEQSMILTSKVTADKNPDYEDVNPGNDTTDKVFLLSISEVKKYLPFADQRKCDMTDYICAQLFLYYKINGHAVTNWTLRSPGSFQDHCAGVRADGQIDCWGTGVSGLAIIRPAMWISLDD